jgi:hypothetical protein
MAEIIHSDSRDFVGLRNGAHPLDAALARCAGPPLHSELCSRSGRRASQFYGVFFARHVIRFDFYGAGHFISSTVVIIILSNYGGMFPDHETRSIGVAAIVSKAECASVLLHEARTYYGPLFKLAGHLYKCQTIVSFLNS